MSEYDKNIISIESKIGWYFVKSALVGGCHFSSSDSQSLRLRHYHPCLTERLPKRKAKREPLLQLLCRLATQRLGHLSRPLFWIALLAEQGEKMVYYQLMPDKIPTFVI